MEEHIEKYSQHYSENSFWNKVKTAALSAGRELIEKALWLYYALIDPDTPKKAKMIILGALGYFILPFDLIPDFIPLIGYTDDLAVLAGAIVIVAQNIKDEHKEKAANRLKEWFG
jgi:uncharacterized membrane protein YkvA (DUF1232 family)